MSFCSILFNHFVEYLSWFCLISSFKNLRWVDKVIVNFLYCRRINFSLAKTTNTFNSTGNRIHITSVLPFDNVKSQLTYYSLELEISQVELIETIFSTHPLTTSRSCAKKIELFEFVQWENCEFRDSLENNGTEYLSLFEYSWEEICNPIICVEITTAWRHRKYGTTYIKHKVFHQSKLIWDVEL